ncbi:hypothetical protein AB6A40_002393 [Gnathostoma spinigerum]|uniref:Uncharacterized protein n=1 Tax=Gnathostoma spinigerum TaxID=75299 RepID=A0ABD6EC12_9BILA
MLSSGVWLGSGEQTRLSHFLVRNRQPSSESSSTVQPTSTQESSDDSRINRSFRIGEELSDVCHQIVCAIYSCN